MNIIIIFFSYSCRNGNSITCEFYPENVNPIMNEVSSSSSSLLVVKNKATTTRNPCEGKNTGRVPNDDDCRMYYVCMLQIAQPRFCNDGQIYDLQSEKCIIGNPNDC